MDRLKPWVFDAAVAESFVEHARRHIPAYDRVIDLSVRLAQDGCAPGDAIAEIGCATGYTLQRLEAAGFVNILGVDCAPAMLDASRARHARLLLSSEFPAEAAPFKLVLANWTLHFVAPGRRRAYLEELRRGLAPGGRLLLSEKTAQSPFTEVLYHDFKRGRGVCEAEIAQKKQRLVGVLEPLPVEWYAATLAELGFRTEILLAEHGFVTFLAST